VFNNETRLSCRAI